MDGYVCGVAPDQEESQLRGRNIVHPSRCRHGAPHGLPATSLACEVAAPFSPQPLPWEQVPSSPGWVSAPSPSTLGSPYSSLHALLSFPLWHQAFVPRGRRKVCMGLCRTLSKFLHSLSLVCGSLSFCLSQGGRVHLSGAIVDGSDVQHPAPAGHHGRGREAGRCPYAVRTLTRTTLSGRWSLSPWHPKQQQCSMPYRPWHLCPMQTPPLRHGSRPWPPATVLVHGYFYHLHPSLLWLLSVLSLQSLSLRNMAYFPVCFP